MVRGSAGRICGKADHVGKQNGGRLAACEGEWDVNTDELVSNSWREKACQIRALPFDFFDALVGREVPKHQHRGGQDRN